MSRFEATFIEAHHASKMICKVTLLKSRIKTPSLLEEIVTSNNDVVKHCVFEMARKFVRWVIPRERLPKIMIHISKNYCWPGGMAPSEWTRSVRAVRETPVEDYSALGVNLMRRVPYCPLIAVSLFLLVLSVSYIKRSLWRCG
jgi:hypothetical protein